MINKDALLRTTEYWIEDIQNKIFNELRIFQEKRELNQTELSEILGYSKGYISQILKGDCNFSIRKLVELSLKLGAVPKLEFEEIDQFVRKNNVKYSSFMEISINKSIKSQSINSGLKHNIFSIKSKNMNLLVNSYEFKKSNL